MDKPLSNQKQQDFLCADTFGMSKQDSPEHLSPSCLLSLGSAQDRPATIGIIHKLLAKPMAHCTGPGQGSVSIQLHSDPKSGSFKCLDGQGGAWGWPHPGAAPWISRGRRRSLDFALDLSTAGKAAPTAFNNHSFNTARCRK